MTASPNIYKLLYSFESHRSNWRRAATYMYRYTVRLKTETNLKELQQLSSAFEERIWGLSAAISALKLVNPAYAWIDSQHGDYYFSDQHSPNKRARKVLVDRSTSLTFIDQLSCLYNLNRFVSVPWEISPFSISTNLFAVGLGSNP